MKTRFLSLALIGVLAVGLAVVLVLEKQGSTAGFNLQTFFSTSGQAVKTADRALSRVASFSGLDEAALGRELATRFEQDKDLGPYIEDVFTPLLSHVQRKELPWTVRVDATMPPNAFALPGGVVVISRALVDLLGSEAEVAAVLAHEIGHVDLGHCLDSVRARLALQKVGFGGLGALADAMVAHTLRTAFGKTMEDEADNYSLEMLVASGYDPLAGSRVFEALQAKLRQIRRKGVLHDYFTTHPDLGIRAARLRALAEAWGKGGSDFYVGTENLKRRVSRARMQFPE